MTLGKILIVLGSLLSIIAIGLFVHHCWGRPFGFGIFKYITWYDWVLLAMGVFFVMINNVLWK